MMNKQTVLKSKLLLLLLMRFKCNFWHNISKSNKRRSRIVFCLKFLTFIASHKFDLPP